jgi:hypothetical protein
MQGYIDITFYLEGPQEANVKQRRCQNLIGFENIIKI